MATSTFSSPLVVAALAAALAGHANGEPGTPSWVKADADNGSAAARPMISLTFKGWKEKARFFVAVTRNGESIQLARAQMFYSGRCVNNFPLAYGTQYNCVMPASAAKSPAVEATDKPGTMGYAMHFRDLEWNSEYCFRLLAQDDRGEYAKLWTGWACARTYAPPPPPGMPTNVRITGLPGVSGSGTIGEGIPDRILVEWTTGSDNATYAVEKAPLAAGARFEAVGPLWREKGLPRPGEVAFMHLVEPKDPIQIRVCGENVIGRVCTTPKRFPPRSFAENVKAANAPRYERGTTPVTPGNARVAPNPFATPTVTQATAAKSPAASPAGASRPSSSSFERNGSFGR